MLSDVHVLHSDPVTFSLFLFPSLSAIFMIFFCCLFGNFLWQDHEGPME